MAARSPGKDLHFASYGPIIQQMQRKSFGDMPCPIARSLERVGEWWSILILRDAFYGLIPAAWTDDSPVNWSGSARCD